MRKVAGREQTCIHSEAMQNQETSSGAATAARSNKLESGGPTRTTSAASATRFLKRSQREDKISVLTFDRPDSAANIFDRATLEELGCELDSLAREGQTKGLIINSAK